MKPVPPTRVVHGNTSRLNRGALPALTEATFSARPAAIAEVAARWCPSRYRSVGRARAVAVNLTTDSIPSAVALKEIPLAFQKRVFAVTRSS